MKRSAIHHRPVPPGQGLLGFTFLVLCACGTSGTMGGAPDRPDDVFISGDADFSTYRTFAFEPTKAAASGVSMPGLEAVVMDTLGMFGLRFKGEPPVDLTVAIRGDAPVGEFGASGSWPVAVAPGYASGLVLQFVDARTRRLVWRGTVPPPILNADQARASIERLLRHYYPVRPRF